MEVLAVLSQSTQTIACSLHEVEIHRLWNAIVTGQSAHWVVSRQMGIGVGSDRPADRFKFHPKGLESLKKALAEGVAYWIARQDAGCGPRPWDNTHSGKSVRLQLGLEVLEILSGLVQGKLSSLSGNPDLGCQDCKALGNQIVSWIIGDWAIVHAPVFLAPLARNVFPATCLIWAACHPRALGFLPVDPPGGSPIPEIPPNSLGDGLFLKQMDDSRSMMLGLLSFLEGALATRLQRAWRVHHKALKEATTLSRIEERARWARQTWPVWELLFARERVGTWLEKLMRWVGEILEPMDGVEGAFAEGIDWKGATLAERQALRRDAFLALRVGASLTQKYEDSLGVGYLDETYDDAQGYLRQFRDAGGAPWKGLVPLFVRELSPMEAPAAISKNEPDNQSTSGEDR